jgi:hypothetical protein
MIVGLFLRRIDVAFNRLRINNNDGASESPGIRRAAHFLFVRPWLAARLVVKLAGLRLPGLAALLTGWRFVTRLMAYTVTGLILPLADLG